MTTAGHLPTQPWMTEAGTRQVVAALSSDGTPVRFVGGCVRDAVAGRPIRDIDLATPLRPETVLRRLAVAGLRAIPTGLAHGTVTAIAGGRPFEITTLRRDIETDGRHARVAFTDDWDADAARRDFTMNALSMSPDGRLHDPFGGLADLAAGRVRFVGDARTRIREDVLRVLRFFRFHAHYGQTGADPAGLAACAELAPLLPRLSGERVRTEILRLLEAAAAARVWTLMIGHGVIAPLLPAASDTARLEGLVRLEAAFGIVGPDRPLVRLAALMPAETQAVRTAAARLRLSNAERDRLLALAAPAIPVSLSDDAPTRRRALLRLRDATLYRDLCLLAAAREGVVEPDDRLRDAFEAAAAWEAARFPLTGRDVLDLGVASGPRIGALIADLEAWWADRNYQPDRAACLAELRRQTDPAP